MTSPMKFEQLVDLCQQTHEEIQKRAVRAVDLSLVVRNWLFGCYLVEFEQNGEDRTAYGKRLLQALAERLKDLGIKGVASTNLKLARQFDTALIREITFPFPPLPEQRAIATALSDVDGLLGGLDRLIAKKRDVKQAAMQQLLTGQTRLPGFHGEWEVKTDSDVCWFQKGPGVRNNQFTSYGVKLLNGTNIFRGRINLKAGFSIDAVAASSGRTGEPGVCKRTRPGKFWSAGKQGFSRDKSIDGSSLFFIVWPFLFRLEIEGQYYGR